MIQIQIWERWVKIPQEPGGECWEAGGRVEHVNMKNSAALIDGQIDTVCLKWKLSECSSRQARKPCSISGRVHNHSTGSPVLSYVPNKLLVLELFCLMRGNFFLMRYSHMFTHVLIYLLRTWWRMTHLAFKHVLTGSLITLSLRFSLDWGRIALLFFLLYHTDA